jgi:MFS family permease
MGWNIFLTFSVMFLFIGFSDFVIVIILVGSLSCGILMSAYYNGINNFVNECGKRDNKVNFYFGIDICIIQCSNIVGNGISALLIEPLGQKAFSFVMLSINIAVSLLYLMIKEFPKENKLL